MSFAAVQRCRRMMCPKQRIVEPSVSTICTGAEGGEMLFILLVLLLLLFLR